MLKNKLVWILIVFLILPLPILSGCSPTVIRDSLREKINDLFIVKTITMPVLVTSRPSKTSTITATPAQAMSTVSPSSTIAATETIKPVSTPTEVSADISLFPESDTDFLEVITDVTIPDGTIFSPNEMFIKSWRLKNAGNQIWNDEYRIVIGYSNPFGSPQMARAIFIQETDLVDFAISSWGPRQYNVRNGGIVDLAIPLQAPNIPGEYVADFFLINSENEIVTPKFWIQFKVELNPELIAKTNTAAVQLSQTPDLTLTPTASPTPELVSFDWTGKWLIRDPFDPVAINTTWSWFTQTGKEVLGFFYDAQGEPVLIEATVMENGRTLEGKFAWPWQNRAAPFTWRMLANKNQFYSVTEDGKMAFGSICGGRNGKNLPEYCSMPSGD